MSNIGVIIAESRVTVILDGHHYQLPKILYKMTTKIARVHHPMRFDFLPADTSPSCEKNLHWSVCVCANRLVSYDDS